MKRLVMDREKRYVSWAWLLLVVFTLTRTGIADAQSVPPMQLRITILEGEGALNNIRERTAREPIVQVEDENHKPVAGALVLFTIHGGSGADATFANNLVTYQTTTDAAGRATAKGLRPNTRAGDITISVTATVGVVTAEAIVHQKNVDPDAVTTAPQSKPIRHFHLSPANVAFIGVVVAVGSILGWGAANSGTSSTTITTGAGGVGAPTSGSTGAARR